MLGLVIVRGWTTLGFRRLVRQGRVPLRLVEMTVYLYQKWTGLSVP